MTQQSYAERIEAAIEASGVRDLGFSCHLRSAGGHMQLLSSTQYAASIRVYIHSYSHGDEIRAEFYTMLPQSMMKVEIGDCQFPHPNMVNFIGQIERLNALWSMDQER